jgi:hypothetical protein
LSSSVATATDDRRELEWGGRILAREREALGPPLCVTGRTAARRHAAGHPRARPRLSCTPGTYEGTATFTPEDPSGVSASGHFAVWFGAAGNNKNEVETNTNTFNLRGSDGSHIVIHASSHVSTNGAGAVTVNFEKMKAHCG